MEPAAVVSRIERLSVLDPLVAVLRNGVESALDDPRLRELLQGGSLGQPLHPALTDLPVGAWTSAAVLDLLPGTGRAAGTLVAAGLAAAGPTALAGWADFPTLPREKQRVALVHLGANALAATLYTGSLWARLRKRWLKGRLYGFAGLGVVTVSGYLGRHLYQPRPRQAPAAPDGEVRPVGAPAGPPR